LSEDKKMSSKDLIIRAYNKKLSLACGTCVKAIEAIWEVYDITKATLDKELNTSLEAEEKQRRLEG
jgi:GTP-dependent phosphoenolpyruvate carboxykinase